MEWYKIFALICAAGGIAGLVIHLAKILKTGAPVDFSSTRGAVKAGVLYSFTGAMSPGHKESAYLHLPVYLSGLLYHAGTLLSIAIFILFIYGIEFSGARAFIPSGLLLVSSVSGAFILIRRSVKSDMRSLSNPDDYLSNILVTVFQVVTIISLLNPSFEVLYYLWAGLMFAWMPAGKLRHSVYFFAARYHLGFFFGRRGVWPPSDK